MPRETCTVLRKTGAFFVLLLMFAVPTAGFAQIYAHRGELSLAEAVALAHRNNPDYLSQEAQGDRAGWATREAWGGFLPSANVSQSLGYSAPGERRFGSVQLATQPGTYSSSYSLGLSYSLTGATLLRPGLVRDQNRATVARIAGAGAGLVDQVTQAYISVAQADAEVAQARTQVERTRQYVRQANAQVEVGAGTPLDIRRAEVQEGQAEVRLLQVQNQAATSRLTLGRIIGLELDEGVALTTAFDLFELDIEAASLVARALASNPVVRASRSQEEAVRQQRRIARSQYYPSLSMSAGWSGSVFQPTTIEPLVADRLRQLSGQFGSCLQENRIRDLLGDLALDCSAFNPDVPQVAAEARRLIEDRNTGWPFDYNSQPLSLSLQISLPIFNGFSRELQLQEAQIAESAARQQVRAEELRLRSEVEAAVRAVRTGSRTVELQGRIREIAAEELRLATERFRIGLASSIEVVDAQANVAQSERDEISAIYDFHRSFASLEALVGEQLR